MDSLYLNKCWAILIIMKTFRVIVETGEEYRAGQRESTIFALSVFWWFFIAAFIGFIVNSFFPENKSLTGAIIIGYMAMFLLAGHFFKGKLRSYLKIIISCSYILIGSLFFITALNMLIKGEKIDYVIFGLVIVALFFGLAIYNLKKYTNLIELILSKSFHIPKNFIIMGGCILVGILLLFVFIQNSSNNVNNLKTEDNLLQVENISAVDSSINSPTANVSSQNPAPVENKLKYCDFNAYFSKDSGEKVDYNKLLIDNMQVSLPYKNKKQNVDIPSYVTFDIYNNNPYSIKFEITYEVKNVPNNWTKSYTLNLEINQNNYQSIKEATDPCGHFAISGGSHCQLHIISINEIDPFNKTYQELCNN